MSVTTLRLLTLRVHRASRGMKDEGPEGPRLQLVTEGGAVRIVPLDRAELVSLIENAAKALAALDRQEAAEVSS